MTYYQLADGSVHDLHHSPSDAKRLTKAEGQRLERERAKAELRKLLTPGSTVNCILRHCSRSGMRRHISLLVGDSDITHLAALAMVEKRADDGGIKVDGCGMDMGFHLVYSLGRALFPDGFCPSSVGIRPVDGKRVQVNVGRGKNAGPMTKPEIDSYLSKGWTFERGRNGDTSGWDNDGGYALKHRWL
jgi:hypothetical protein